MEVIYQLNDDDCSFPSAELANRDGLLAFGGDLSPERLLMAYANGIFPWYNELDPILWWSLDPRLIIRPGEMKVSKSLRRTVASGKFEVRIDTNFENVMLNCATVERDGQNGTWIHDEMIDAYCNLHKMGFAHSFETYKDNELVGGLYGLAIGKAFFGESMFHKVSDASKVAFCHLHEFLKQHDFKIIDCQQETPHLKSLGAFAIPRKDFLDEIGELVKMPTLKGNWGTGNTIEVLLKIHQEEDVEFRCYDIENQCFV